MKRFAFVLAWLLLTFIAHAQTINPVDTTFAWDAPPSPGSGILVSYELCHSITSGEYVDTDCIDAGTSTQFTWHRALGKGRHYFVVRAKATINGSFVKSGNSNEVSVSLLAPINPKGRVE